jgi:flavin-dependent dehydrogenase
MAIPHYDVVIAGAGPAGCAAAIRLRQLNITVCLVDDAKDTVLKVGESLPGAAIRLLNRIGINDINQLLPKTDYSICIANVSAWGMDNWTYNDAIRNPENGGWHILRHKFDAALRQLALQNGVAFYNAKIGKIIANDTVDTPKKANYTLAFKTQEAYLPSAISAQWIMDATGRASTIVKQLKIDRFHFEEQLSAIAWLKPTDKNPDSTTRIKSVENGWWYSAKLPDNSRVIAFYGLASTVSKMVKTPSLFIEETNSSKLLEDTINQDDILEGVSARNAATSLAKEVIGDSWIAIGDSALSLDPISSQGMFFALYSGIRGAETIASVMEDQNDLSEIRNAYKQKIESVFIANQNSRKHFYTSELRYPKNPYWQQYLKGE